MVSYLIYNLTNLTSDFSPETSEDNVGIYENRAYGTEALYANMDRSERPEPTMEPERIHVDDLHVRLHIHLISWYSQMLLKIVLKHLKTRFTSANSCLNQK